MLKRRLSIVFLLSFLAVCTIVIPVMAKSGGKPTTIVTGGGNFISDKGTLDEKCTFGFQAIERDEVWTGHGSFNGMKIKITEMGSHGPGSDGQEYYMFIGTIGHDEISLTMWVAKYPDGSDNVQFEFDTYLYHGTAIHGKIQYHTP